MKNLVKILLLSIIFLSLSCEKKDACLDGGGCWDSVDNMCRKDEPNAQELCNRGK